MQLKILAEQLRRLNIRLAGVERLATTLITRTIQKTVLGAEMAKITRRHVQILVRQGLPAKLNITNTMPLHVIPRQELQIALAQFMFARFRRHRLVNRAIRALFIRPAGTRALVHTKTAQIQIRDTFRGIQLVCTRLFGFI